MDQGGGLRPLGHQALSEGSDRDATVFALAYLLFSNPQVSLFGAFGSFALLLLVDFPGRPRTRLISYLASSSSGAVSLPSGTVVSTHRWPRWW